MELPRDHAGLYDRHEVLAIDLLDARERVRREDDASSDRDRTARAPCASSARRHGHVARVSHLERTRYVKSGLGDDDHVGGAARGVAVVAGVRCAGIARGEHLGWTEPSLELEPGPVDGCASGQRYVGGAEQHEP